MKPKSGVSLSFAGAVGRLAGMFALFLFVAVIVSIAIAPHAGAMSHHVAPIASLGSGGLLFAGMLALPQPLNIDGLDAARRPPAGAVDCYPDVLYSQVDYPAAGQAVGTPLQFFQGAETNPRDITQTNVPNGFLVGQRFHALYAFIVPILELTGTTGVVANIAVNRTRDIDRILKTNRGFISYTYSVTNKVRGPFPLDAFGEMGAIMPDFGGSSAPAAGDSAVLNHTRTGASGGWPLNLILYENEGFPFNMQWGVQTAISAALPLRLVLYGWRYVRNAA